MLSNYRNLFTIRSTFTLLYLNFIPNHGFIYPLSSHLYNTYIIFLSQIFSLSLMCVCIYLYMCTHTFTFIYCWIGNIWVIETFSPALLKGQKNGFVSCVVFKKKATKTLTRIKLLCSCTLYVYLCVHACTGKHVYKRTNLGIIPQVL